MNIANQNNLKSQSKLDIKGNNPLIENKKTSLIINDSNNKLLSKKDLNEVNINKTEIKKTLEDSNISLNNTSISHMKTAPNNKLYIPPKGTFFHKVNQDLVKAIQKAKRIHEKNLEKLNSKIKLHNYSEEEHVKLFIVIL